MANIKQVEKKSKEEVSAIVKSLGINLGILLYPNGQRLALVTDEGEVLNKLKALLVVLYLFNHEANGKKKAVFLPTWAPDFMDNKFDNLIIERGKYANFKAKKLKQYDLIATIDGNFAFTEFSLHRDAIYATLKIMEMLSRWEQKLSNISKIVEEFYYHQCKIKCTQEMKGKIMRRFLQVAKDKKSSTVDGVKIWENDTDWVLMIPDQFGDHLNLYIQAKDEITGEELDKKYESMIAKWMEKK
jgi:mannose-1-phosphate guanylyltransferase/phosphomannomutase